MFISYFDESGDDGFPSYSSELFVLTSVYFHHSAWKSNFQVVHDLRKQLFERYGLPVKQEFHAKEFVTDKLPYHGKYSPQQRKSILFEYFDMLLNLEFKVISVCINKLKIKRPQYDVLKNALTYNVQRIENDLNYLGTDARFLIITDEGRVSKMRSTTRALQKINYIPSQFGQGSYRKEIRNLIEDPLPKPSNESYFIQVADLLCFIISLYVKQNVCSPKIPWGKRILNVLTYGEERLLLQKIKTKLNLKATSSNEFGIVCYPK